MTNAKKELEGNTISITWINNGWLTKRKHLDKVLDVHKTGFMGTHSLTENR